MEVRACLSSQTSIMRDQSPPWTFQEPMDVKTANRPGVFYHLGSGGRMGIAVSAELVGVAWEDNRDRIPRCYVALIDYTNSRRVIEKQVSDTGSAYEPALLGLNDGQFAVAWEEESGLWVRILTESEMFHLGFAISTLRIGGKKSDAATR